MGKDDDTVISADDTVISADDTVISADVTVIFPDHDTIVVQTAVQTPVQTAVQIPAQIHSQPMRRITDTRTAAPVPTMVFGLRFASGARYELVSAVIVGRAPRHAWTGKERASNDRVVQLVSVPSREGRVSSTHVEFRQLGDVVVVTDMRSTNGTRVSLAGGATTQLAPGDSMSVGEGAVVDVGDGNRIEVLREKPRDASKDIAR